MAGLRRFVLCHRHDPHECSTSFAAWKGHPSPLRHRPAHASCLFGGHAVWWFVEASDSAAALALLPRWVAARTEVVQVRSTTIP
jgi:hypothetical protein